MLLVQGQVRWHGSSPAGLCPARRMRLRSSGASSYWKELSDTLWCDEGIIDDIAVQPMLLAVLEQVAGPVDEASAREVERGVAQHAESGDVPERLQQLGHPRVALRGHRLGAGAAVDVGDGLQLVGGTLLKYSMYGSCTEPTNHLSASDSRQIGAIGR